MRGAHGIRRVTRSVELFVSTGGVFSRRNGEHSPGAGARSVGPLRPRWPVRLSARLHPRQGDRAAGHRRLGARAEPLRAPRGAHGAPQQVERGARTRAAHVGAASRDPRRVRQPVSPAHPFPSRYAERGRGSGARLAGGSFQGLDRGDSGSGHRWRRHHTNRAALRRRVRGFRITSGDCRASASRPSRRGSSRLGGGSSSAFRASHRCQHASALPRPFSQGVGRRRALHQARCFSGRGRGGADAERRSVSAFRAAVTEAVQRSTLLGRADLGAGATPCVSAWGSSGINSLAGSRPEKQPTRSFNVSPGPGRSGAIRRASPMQCGGKSRRSFH